MAVFTLTRREGAEQAPVVIGQAQIDETGNITLLRVDAAAEDAVAFALEDLNGRDALIMKVAPGVGDAPFTVVKERVLRGDDRFLAAIQDNVRRWHDLELVPAD
jgi:hypothetical protein